MSAHIFIAEDEAPISTLLKYNLEKEGHKVSSSENGEDSLKSIKQKMPDLILLDWMLPDLSGVEICKQLNSGEGMALKAGPRGPASEARGCAGTTGSRRRTLRGRPADGAGATSRSLPGR
jgi:CheY-like chemotaxis protein